MLNDRLANDVRRNGTHSSGTDDDRWSVVILQNWKQGNCAPSRTIWGFRVSEKRILVISLK